MKKDNFIKLKIALPEIKENILLKDYTSFKIGGRAKYFFLAKTKQDFIKAIKIAKQIGLRFFILGDGSNLLISDKDYDGLAIKYINSEYKIIKSNINISAGARLSELVNLARQNNLSGMEWAIAIPGTVGGAINGDTGAFGNSMKDIIKTVTVLQISNSKLNHTGDALHEQTKIFKNKDCQFGYRDSIFKKNKNLIIISAEIQLKKGDKQKIKTKMMEYLDHRIKIQPLKFASAGSIFKNASLKDIKFFSKFRVKIQNDEKLKLMFENNSISAGYLIEKCQLKGKKIGDIQISEKHSNFIVNLGQGKAEQVLDLIKIIKTKVKEKFGIELQEEIQYLE